MADTQLAAGAVQAESIAAGAVENSKLSNAGLTLNTGAGLAGGGSVDLGGTLTLSIPDAGVTGPKLADDAVSTAKIAAGAVTNAKLANSAITINAGAGLTGTSAVSLGGNVTLSIPNGGVTAAQLAPGAAAANYAADGQSFGLINGIPVNQWLGTAGIPTFAGQTILNTGTGSNKPALVLDRGIIPKGRVSFQRSSEEAGWSGLVLSINADWSDTAGYVYDDGVRSQSIMQLEYEWLAPGGFRQNEFNWTSSGRRIWAHHCRTDDSTKAAVAFLAPTNISVPSTDTSGTPALKVESFAGVGDAVQIVLQNNNVSTPAAATQIYMRGAGSVIGATGFITDWAVGTDRYWTGTSNFYILDVNGAVGQQERLFIDPAGNIGTKGNTNPQYALDVNGDVNVTGTFRVKGIVATVPKQGLSRLAVELPSKNATTQSVAIAPGSYTPAVRVYEGNNVGV